MKNQEQYNKQTFEHFKDIVGMGLAELNAKLILNRAHTMVYLYKEIRNNQPFTITSEKRVFQGYEEDVSEIVNVLKDELKEIDIRVKNSISIKSVENTSRFLNARMDYNYLIVALEECI